MLKFGSCRFLFWSWARADRDYTGPGKDKPYVVGRMPDSIDMRWVRHGTYIYVDASYMLHKSSKIDEAVTEARL